MYFLSYKDKSSMLFITGRGGQRSSTLTNVGLCYTCNSAFRLDLSNDTFVDAYYSHPSGSPVTLVVELEEWEDSSSSKLQGDMERMIAGLCEEILPVNSMSGWTKAILKELIDIGLLTFSLDNLKVKEGAARAAYHGIGSETHITAREL